jgi:lon-related putative ATP-dependent protease
MSSRGGIKTSFMRIKAGSLIQASGGFLILQAEDILRDDNVWHRFKNALMSGQAEIIPGENSFMPSAILLKPEPVKVDVKVIIIGDPHLYDYLYTSDRDFQKLFKVAAEFDSEIERTPENMMHYINFIKSIIQKEKLKKITHDGITAIIEYGMRIAEHRDRLSTKFSQVADLLCEADYWARKNNLKMIDNRSIQQAIDEKCYLSNLPEEKYMEMITRGEILLSVSGTAVGKVNALCLFDRGYYCFGRPTLITAQITPGQLGVINIERESGLSGIIHDKGVLILEGYIRSHYSRDCPLSITASICFEQSYAPIDGDSASIAELSVLLSSLADIPLRQDLAITGSVNQMGEIQPIGGVTEKVEGFYKTCKEIHLTGSQGVIIPAQNVPNLILCDEVRQAVKEEKFHIYAIKNVDEALELLTGCKAGKKNKEGYYPKESLNGIIEENLRKMAEQVRAYRHI